MANWSILKTAIADVIRTNGNQEITGQVLQSALNSMINALGEYPDFAGVATPTTAPGVFDGPVFFLAATPGSYPNFSNITLNSGELVILRYSENTWTKEVLLEAASMESVEALIEALRLAFEAQIAEARSSAPIADSMEQGTVDIRLQGISRDFTVVYLKDMSTFAAKVGSLYYGAWPSWGPYAPIGSYTLTPGRAYTIGGKLYVWNGSEMLDMSTPIINDLTTGGADKALSAEIGKELKREVAELSAEVSEVNETLGSIVEGGGSPNLFEPTINGMFYTQYGKETEVNYAKCQILSVIEGDVLSLYVWNGSSYIPQKAHVFAAYSNGINQGAKGASNVVSYTVPNGIDEVRVGIAYSGDSSNLCLLKNMAEPPQEKVLYGAAFRVKTDNTLTDGALPANAKAVGIAINNLQESTNEALSPMSLTLSRKDWTSENADKDNIYRSEDESNIIHAVNERYAALREVKRMTDADILVQGYCGYYEDASGNITHNTIQWKIYKGGILYIGGYGKFYDFVKGVECCKTIAEINAEVTRLGADYWYYGFNANNVNGIVTPYGVNDQIHGGDVMQYHPKRYVPFGEDVNADNNRPIGYAAPWYQYRNEVSMLDGLSPNEDTYTSHSTYDSKNPNGIYYDRVCIDEDLTNGGITYLGDWTFYRCCVDNLLLPSQLQKIGAWGVRYSPTMRTLVMYDGVTEIEDHGISRNLAMVTLRMSESLNKVGYQSLGQNPCIKHIELPSSVTEGAKNLFMGNTCLESIVANGITDVPKDFANGCSNLSRIVLGDVTHYGANSLFKSRINELTLGVNVSTIESGTFVNCRIEYLTIDNPTIFSTIDTGTSHGNILNAAKRYYVPEGTPMGAVVKYFYEKVATENGYDVYKKIAQ